MGSGLFYNVPYFRLGLTAFYGPPAVHLHVSGRQEHCIIMSFPAPKCYFTGRGSFLKLHHFYNFPNFYSRHYYQQDFITYLECKQVWVMILPCLPGSFPSDGCAAISGTRIHTHTHTNTCLFIKMHNPLILWFAHPQLHKKYAYIHSHKLHQSRYNSNTRACACVCMYVFLIKGEAVGANGGGGEFYTQLT